MLCVILLFVCFQWIMTFTENSLLVCVCPLWLFWMDNYRLKSMTICWKDCPRLQYSWSCHVKLAIISMVKHSNEAKYRGCEVTVWQGNSWLGYTPLSAAGKTLFNLVWDFPSVLLMSLISCSLLLGCILKRILEMAWDSTGWIMGMDTVQDFDIRLSSCASVA